MCSIIQKLLCFPFLNFLEVFDTLIGKVIEGHGEAAAVTQADPRISFTHSFFFRFSALCCFMKRITLWEKSSETF